MRFDRALIDSLIVTAGTAPSAHNTQPWVPEIVGCADCSAEVVVAVDPARTLPHGDPRSEDLHLSMGCWVESLTIAAAEAGVAVESVTVRGRGPALTIRLHLGPTTTVAEPAAMTPEADRLTAPGPTCSTAENAWPAFTVADLHHRQVDRGRLDPAETRFAEAVAACRTALSGTQARLVEVPDRPWRSWVRRAVVHSYGVPDVFRETLHWLRFAQTDPLYHQDGLNAGCLRIPPPAARIAALVDRPKLHSWITGAAAVAMAPAVLLGKRRTAEVSNAGSGRGRSPMQSATDDEEAPEARGRPHHLILAVTDDPALTPGDEVAMGRVLLRIWLLLDRYGLRVDVHSEVKDSPDTRRQVAADLRRRPAGPYSDRAVDGTAAILDRPLGAFSVGRSTTAVPRSSRLSPRSLRPFTRTDPHC